MASTPVKMKKPPNVAPGTPEYMASLSRELESVIAQKNLLTCKSRRKVLDALQASAQEGEEEQVDRLRFKAVEELLQSEKSYLRHLEIVEEFFMGPLKEKDMIPHQDFVKIFGDLPAIIQVNKELLSSLEESVDRIGKVFLELSPYLKFYSTYAQDFQGAAKLVEKWTERHKGFKTFLENQETRPEIQLKLNALLITPVQRIPRYKMLLEDVIKNTPEQHPDRNNLNEALRQIEDVAWHINDQLREHENNLKMWDIQRSLVGQFPKIIIPGRKLIKHGNLMKVPRNKGGSGQPRYFVLFSDIIMYCKIKISGIGKLILPKSNSLECGCIMPLKHTKIETLVGKGVFKITCKEEQLILYSQEVGESEEWVDSVGKTIEQHKKDASTLRKESSRRDPLKRPEILKMRRESLSQIMLNTNKHKMTLRERRFSPKKLPFLSPKRGSKNTPCDDNSNSSFKKSSKRMATSPPMDVKMSPKKLFKEDQENDESFQRRPMPPPQATPASSVKLRRKKIERPSFKTLSFTRRIKEEEKAPAALFRSPSIYEEDDDDKTVVSSYLSGKYGPLTPSQQQTDISHLVKKGQTERDGDDKVDNSRALVPVQLFSSEDKQNPGSSNYCSVM